MMSAASPVVAAPRAVLIYGLLGVIPFVAPALAGLLWPALRPAMLTILTLYAALILSFLGGARWGLTVGTAAPSPLTVSLAMLPTLVGLAILLMANDRPACLGLAAGLMVQWLWDVTAIGLPGWYGRLRTILTAGAVTGLLAGTFVLT
jgi:hypothetical protein